MSNGSGTIYLVSTPIGNLDDISPRAVKTLASVDLVVAEDTRHSSRLLRHHGIDTQLLSFHEHNEAMRVQQLVASARSGNQIAVISDAGTPLISDPGYRLVRAAHQAGVAVSAVPGACAAIVALTVSGMPTDKFCFRGFPPAKTSARQKRFAADRGTESTLVYYESPHRIVDSLNDMCAVFGGKREATLARELTKKFETVKMGELDSLVDWITADHNQQKGEFVVVVHGAEACEPLFDEKAQLLLRRLAQELPPKKAAAIVSEITGLRKKLLYNWLADRE